jgi:hypothetical protein
MRTTLIAGLLLAAATSLAAQDESSGESAAARLQRDQARVGTRLTGLRDKMERLAQRYQDEGRARNAQLLRDALSRFDEQKLLDVQRDVQRGLEQGSLSTVERQDALAAGLESVYAVLRDRRDAEELQKQADLARQGLAQLSVMAENERRLLAKTRASSDTPADLLKQALQSAADLFAALTQTQQASQLGQKTDEAMGDADLAAQLAAQQRALAQDAAPAPQTQSLLQQALALLRERLEQATPSQKDATLAAESLAAAQSARDRARDAAADAAQEMQAAKDALDAASRGESAPAQPPGGQPQSGGSKGKSPTSANPSGGAPSPSPEGRTPSGQQQGGQQQGGQQPGAQQPSGQQQGGQQPSGQTPSGQQQSGQPPSGQQQSGQTPSGKNPDGRPAGSATPSQPSAQQPPAGGQPAGAEAGKPPTPPTPPRDEPPAVSAARERMEAAAARLDEVKDELERSDRSLAAARNRARAAAEASAEEAQKGGSSLDELAQRLEASQPQSGPELLDRTRALLDELAKMQQAAQQGQLDEAAKQAGAAQTSLDQLIEMLKARQAGAADTPKEPVTQADLDKLAQEQAELQHQVEDLMRRLSGLPEQGFQQPAGAAQKAMQGAQDSLKSGDSREGATREQEAAEKLEQAAQQMSGASNKYEQLRQEEVLFRLTEDLTALLQHQQEASADTKELDGARSGEERLSRSQRRTAGRLAESERDLSTQAEAMRDALQKDEALAFEHALAQTRDDLTAIADKLGDEQTGWNVQMLQGDVEQRLQDLLAVLAAEHQRREEALKNPEQQDGGQGNQQQGQEALVPPVAELLLIQRLEQAALARLDAYAKDAAARPEGSEPSDGERDMLQRWAGEHQAITTLFREKFQQLDVKTGADGAHGQPGEPPKPGQPPEPKKEGPR